MKLLIAALICVSSLHFAYADGKEADALLRSVQIDWEPIQGADQYEFETFTDSDCAKSDGLKRAASPTWEGKLPGGRYCIRVRAVGDDGRQGQWSDFQKLEVRPKPPREVRRDSSGDKFEWDSIPKADHYDIKVVDTDGREWLKTQVKSAEFKIPEKLFERKGIRPDQLQLSVQSVVSGVEPSVPNLQSLLDPKMTAEVTGGESGGTGYAGAEGANGGNGGPQTPPEPVSGASKDGVLRVYAPTQIAASQGAQERLRSVASKYPNQKSAMAPDPDEAVRRYFSFGEKPIAPTSEEWSQAQSLGADQKESLRRRSIASQRIEMIDRIDRGRPPDVAVSLGLLGGGTNYQSTVPGSTPGSMVESNVTTHLQVEYNRNRPWGAYLSFFRQSVQSTSQSAFSLVTVGATRNILLDPMGESELRLGAGLGYGRFPLMLGISGSNFSYPIAVIGFDFFANYAFHFNDKWSMNAGLEAYFAPTQANLSDVLPKVTANQAVIHLGPSYQVSSQMELELGAFALGAKGSAESAGIRSEDSQKGAYFQATYRMNPRESRKIASEGTGPRLWELSFAIPYASRNAMVRNNSGSIGGGGNPALAFPFNVDAKSFGGELFITRRMESDFGWSFFAGVSHNELKYSARSTGESQVRLGAGFDRPFLGSPTTAIRYKVSAFVRSVSAVASMTDASLSAVGLAPGVQLTRHWGGKWKTDVEVELGVPILVSSDTYPLNSDKKTTRDGANYFWKAGFSAGYELSPSMRVFGGYSYEQLRFGASSTSTNPTTANTIDLDENRFKLGVQWSW